jgi:hypothetical protein
MLMLLIKGNPVQAAAHAAYWGVRELRAVKYLYRYDETAAYVTAQHYNSVVAWFKCSDLAPYAPGDLLYYH